MRQRNRIEHIVTISLGGGGDEDDGKGGNPPTGDSDDGRQY
jgi:hypothetical protein